MPEPWTLLEYTTDTGACPVRAFLDGLKDRNEVEALALLARC